MGDIISWWEDEYFHKKDFVRFMREVVIQAEKLQIEERYKSAHHHDQVFGRPHNKGRSARIETKVHSHIQ